MAGRAPEIARGPAGSTNARLGSVPCGDIDNRQLRMLGNDPFGFRSLLAHASDSLGVLHPLASIPHLPPDVNRIRQNADAAPDVAVYRRHGPRLAARRSHTVPIQTGRDTARARAGEIFTVDTADDIGLLGIDRALPHGGDPIAEWQTTSTRARERAPRESAVRLLRQIVQVQLGHKPAQADVRLVRPRRFPTVADDLQRKKDSGRADALLIALWYESVDLGSHLGRAA